MKYWCDHGPSALSGYAFLRIAVYVAVCSQQPEYFTSPPSFGYSLIPPLLMISMPSTRTTIYRIYFLEPVQHRRSLCHLDPAASGWRSAQYTLWYVVRRRRSPNVHVMSQTKIFISWLFRDSKIHLALFVLCVGEWIIYFILTVYCSTIRHKMSEWVVVCERTIA